MILLCPTCGDPIRRDALSLHHDLAHGTPLPVATLEEKE